MNVKIDNDLKAIVIQSQGTAEDYMLQSFIKDYHNNKMKFVLLMENEVEEDYTHSIKLETGVNND